MRRGAVFVLRRATPRSFSSAAVRAWATCPPMARVLNERRDSAARRGEQRSGRAAIGVLQITCYKLLARRFFEKTGGDFRRFRMGAGTSGMISVKVSAFSENTAETCGENDRGKGKKGELCGVNWGLLTRNWRIFRGFSLRIGRKRSIYCTSCTINHTNVAQILYFCR